MRRGRTATVMWSTFRGATAALSMSGMRTVTTQFGLVRQTPPEVMMHSNVPGLLAQVPEERRGAVVELAHCGYGAMGGALYACLPEAVRQRTWAGPLYGMALWFGFEAFINPLLGVRDTSERNWPGKVAVAVDHVLYGVILAEPSKTPGTSTTTD